MSISCEIRVIEFAAQIMPVLCADSGLEAVVVSVSGVLLLVDTGEALVGTQDYSGLGCSAREDWFRSCCSDRPHSRVNTHWQAG